ncbi:MAG: hypothetical protein QNJ72_07265 [Pleurocapsa sp. MO_226.B13]|nr:hypothetical protein [Pleurocapsa sp. MO_226.B13]
MSAKSKAFPVFKYWFNKGKQHFSRIPILIWLNAITIILLSLLSIYARIKSKGSGIESLFSDPFYVGIFYLGWFTSISEILWCSAISICLFSAILLPASNRRFKIFLFASSLVMLLLFFDDRFRLTLILCAFFGTCKLVKLSVYSLYGVILIFYAWFFRQTIRQTPYIPLLVSFCLFGFSSAIDITPISSRGIHAMLEDGTKLIGLINLTIYFWWICQQKIKKNLVQKS